MTTTVTAADAPPVSVAQEALWYQNRLAPMSIPYNEAISLRKDGPLDLTALRKAFREIVRRHEAWRTTFDTSGGVPVQVLWPVPELELPVLDLSHLRPDEAERHAARIASDLSRVPYNLRRGPLQRPRLIRFPGEHHRLYLAMHHIIFDGVSMYRVVLPELVALYESFLRGAVPHLPEPARYTEYARWQQRWIDSERARRRLNSWRERLRDAPRLLLPHDRPRPAEQSFRGGVIGLTVPADTVESLRGIGQRSGSTLFQVLAAAWALLLGRYSGQRDVIFATAADLRQRPEFESVVGYCLTPLVLRVDLAGAPTFDELIVRTRNELLDGLDRIVPFERLVRELGVGSDLGGNPIYQTMIVLEPAVRAPDPSWSVHQMESEIGDRVGVTKLDLELELDERPDGHLSGRVIYDRDLFDPETAARIGAHFAQLLISAAADPGASADALPMLSVADERQQLLEWNATTTVGGSDRRQALVAEVGLGAADVVLTLPGDDVTPWLVSSSGARMILAPDGCDGAALSKLIRREKVSFIHAAPSVWRGLIDSGLSAARELRILCGGEALDSELAADLLQRCRLLWHAYGGEATGGYATIGPVRDPTVVAIGRPLADVRAYVLDPHRRPLPLGAPGDLWLGGDGISCPADAPNLFGAGPALRTGETARWRATGELQLVDGA